MNLYLDCCALQRPFDDRSQLRIRVESEAIQSVFELFEVGKITLLSSEVLLHELSYIADQDRREFCFLLLRKSPKTIPLSEAVITEARSFEQAGIDFKDALHLASASHSDIDFFCTCDDKFYTKAKQIAGLRLNIVTPLELIVALSK